jgi:hypothetical protein
MSVNVKFVQAFEPGSAYCISNVDALTAMRGNEPHWREGHEQT